MNTSIIPVKSPRGNNYIIRSQSGKMFIRSRRLNDEVITPLVRKRENCDHIVSAIVSFLMENPDCKIKCVDCVIYDIRE